MQDFASSKAGRCADAELRAGAHAWTGRDRTGRGKSQREAMLQCGVELCYHGSGLVKSGIVRLRRLTQGFSSAFCTACSRQKLYSSLKYCYINAIKRCYNKNN
jgi:hypothetical protein